MSWWLPALAIAQAVGIVLADRLAPRPDACWLAAGAALAAAAAARAAAPRAVWLVAASAALGAATLATPLAGARRGPDAPFESIFEATVDASWRQGVRLRVDWRDAAAVAGGPPVPGRLRLHGAIDPRVPAALQSPLPGERWRVRARLRRAAPSRNPGSPDRARSLARRGLGVQGGWVHPGLAVRVGPDGGWRRALAAVRRRRAARLAGLGPGGGLLAALGLGDRSALSEDAREDFARLGLAHLLAVSGLHLGLAAGAAFGLARAALARVGAFAARHDPRRAAAACALPAAAGYALLSGLALPAQRALVLLLAAGLALALRRPRRAATPLALASFLLLARAPHDLFAPGFQLSFGATAALLASRPAGRDEVAPAWRPARALAGVLRTSASALLATSPLAAWHFGAAAPFALVANLAAIPATGLALLPISAGAALLAGRDGPGAAWLLGAAERVAAAALALAAAAADALPTARAAAFGAVPAWALALAAALALLGIRCARTRWRLLALGAQAALLAAVPPPTIRPAPPRAVFLDVGQGDATLVQGVRGTLLVDAGRALPDGFDAGAHTVAPALAALGVARIDRLAVSHADLDHRGGVPAVLERLPVGGVWLPPGGLAEPAFAPLREAARRRGVPVEERDAASPSERLGDLRVSFLGPPAGRGFRARNDASLVLRVGVAGRTLLLPGDVGAAGEGALRAGGTLAPVDLLLLPHHGSRTSSGAVFLDAVAPGLAVVSAPCRGPFPMPHPSVRARLAARGIPLRWTGRDGAVIVGLGERRRVRTWGAPRRGCFGEGAP